VSFGAREPKKDEIYHIIYDMIKPFLHNFEEVFQNRYCLIKHYVLSKLMSKTNSKIAVLIASLAVLLGAAMIANPIEQVNAQGNQSQGNKTNNTGGAKAVTVTKIDVDPIMKALKDAYPKAGDIKDDNVDAVKDLKDAKEAAKTLVAASLLRDLAQFKALQDMK